MILSNQHLLSDNQDLAQAAGSYASTNYHDFGAVGTPYGKNALTRDIAYGEPVPFTCKVTEAFTSGGAATLIAVVQVDDNTAFSSATNVLTSKTWAVADLAAGVNLFAGLYLPKGITERYMRVQYTIATAAMTTGKVTAGISGQHQTN